MVLREYMLALSLAAYAVVAGSMLAREFSAIHAPDKANLSIHYNPGANTAAFSTRSRHAALMRCDRALALPYANLQPEHVRDAIAKQCL